MKKSHIIILLSSFTFIFLVLGITFAILKSSNDEYLKSNPQIKNNDSDTYLGLSIIFFTLFVAGLGLSIYLIILGFYINYKNNEKISTPLYKPLIDYKTPKDEVSNTDTPNGILNIKEPRNVPIFPSLN